MSISLIDFINESGYMNPEEHIVVTMCYPDEQNNSVDFKDIELNIKNLAYYGSYPIHNILIEDNMLNVYINKNQYEKIYFA